MDPALRREIRRVALIQLGCTLLYLATLEIRFVHQIAAPGAH